MFPNVKAKEESAKDKTKEKQWNERLSGSRIPEYSPIKDKHTGSYRKLLTNNSKVVSKNEEKEQEASKKIIRKTFFEKKLETMAIIKQKHPDHFDEVKAYEELMNKQGAPNFYSYFSLLPLTTVTDIKGYLQPQLSSLKDKTSHYHRISTCIRARDECLERLHKTLLRMKESEVLQLKSELKEQVSHLRMLTTNIIDEIKAWRTTLGSIEEKAIYYSDEQANYLIKALNDNKFIFNSSLSSVINFAEKNDPFIIVPLKKAEGKQKSEFYDIVALSKEMPYYQKYMEYLASEKAYDLNVAMGQNPQKKKKSESVQKIYGQSKTKNFIEMNKIDEKIHEDEDVLMMEKQKQREERLKKNQERINSIKGIYEHYASKKKGSMSERKIAETDVDEKRETFKIKKKPKKNDSESDFEGLVKLKMDTERAKAPKKIKESKSMTKMNKNERNDKSEDKMLDNLKEMQASLKNKLETVQKQHKNEEASAISLSTTRFPRKNNEELIKELKADIISKIERENQEKQKIRKKKKDDEQKAFDEIKQKMKKEMEEKLEQKKKEKIMEREELEKRLKEEQERLNNQRQFQIQLQLKLNKEKEMRELEKIRRESLEKERKFREELEREQKLRKEREEVIEREKKQKERLLEQLKKKQLKEQIEEDLRKQIAARKKIEDEQAMKHELNAVKNQKQEQLEKEIQLLKMKEREELNLIQKEAQIREKMLKLKKDEEELKRKQVEQLMKNMIQKEKEELGRQALQKRIELEEEMRTSIKEKMLEEYKAEREEVIEGNRMKREKELEEEVYREKIREKIERQMRIEAINRTKDELDDRETKKYEMKSRLTHIKTNLEVDHKLDRNKLQDEVKKQVIQKVIFDKNAEREFAKTELRAQFQKELLSSAIPQIYHSKDNFQIKDTHHYLADQHLNKTIDHTKVQIPTNQKPTQHQNNLPTHRKDVRSIITNEQLQIYSKQKSKLNDRREEDIEKPPKRLQEEEEGFELLNARRGEGSDDEYDIQIIRKEKPQKAEEVYEKKKKKGKHDSDSDEERKKKKKKNKKKKRVESSQESSEIDSEDEAKRRKKKKVEPKKSKKKIEKEESNEENDDSDYAPIKKKLDFKTSEDEMEVKKRQTKKSKISKKKKESSQSEQEVKKVKVHYDVEDKKGKEPNLTQIQPITIKKTNMKQAQVTNKFQISLDAIPEDDLDEYLGGHFSRLPEEQVQTQIHQRQELYRKLIGELTFCLLLGHFDNKLVGMAYAYHDRNRSDIRKFVIVHAGTYKNEDLKQFILSVTNYIFKKDPSDEIQFHYQYDENQEHLLAQSNDFNKWFDKFGNVYQKRMHENTFERKYVMKRQFNQKCEVVLGGVNKNTFRNIFSVYSGVMMSDADMVVFKEDLRDVLAPEDEVSYAIMMAELFRTYLTPDQAETLKGKVKEFAKLKELLVLVVMLQKKKVKMDELKLYEYKNLIELNMRLMSQGKDVIRYVKDSGVELNRIFFCELNYGFNLPFNFQTTSLPVEASKNQIRQVSYFRLSPLPPYKLHIIKSAVYNGELNVLPTENSKYKLFIMNATEYMELKDSTKMDLFMYIRLFLKNVKSHNVAAWKYVWMPEMTDKGAWSVREFRSFLNKDIYAHDAVNISYRQFLPGALIIEPEHRDLVITPPFIVGIMSMTLEQVTEGSPLYARLIDIDALRTLQVEE